MYILNINIFIFLTHTAAIRTRSQNLVRMARRTANLCKTTRSSNGRHLWHAIHMRRLCDSRLSRCSLARPLGCVLCTRRPCDRRMCRCSLGQCSCYSASMSTSLLSNHMSNLSQHNNDLLVYKYKKKSE